MTGKSGMVLILVLVVLGLVAGIVLNVQMTSRAFLRIEQASHQRQQLIQAATDAVREALYTLATDEEPTVDYPGEPWAQVREQKTPDGMVTRTRLPPGEPSFIGFRTTVTLSPGFMMSRFQPWRTMMFGCPPSAPMRQIEGSV